MPKKIQNIIHKPASINDIISMRVVTIDAEPVQQERINDAMKLFARIAVRMDKPATSKPTPDLTVSPIESMNVAPSNNEKRSY